MKEMLGLLLVLGMLGQSISPAEILDITAEETQARQVEDGLSDAEREISGSLQLDGGYDVRAALLRLWQRLLLLLREKIREETGFAGRLILIALGCSLGAALYPGGKAPPWLELACCSAAVLLLIGSTEAVMNQAEESLCHLQDYAKAAFPAFFTTLAACGAPGGAALRYAAVQFTANVFMTLAQELILPLIRGYLTLSVCSAMFDNAILRAGTKLFKWAAVTGMSLLCTGFCAYMGLTGLISGSADAAAVKGAKTVIAAALPVVGGILSDSAGAMLAAAGIIKNSAGIFCLVSVCAICVMPFAVLAAKRLAVKAAAALATLGGSERYCAVLNGFGNCFAMLLGLVGSFGLMLFYAILSGVRVAAG